MSKAYLNGKLVINAYGYFLLQDVWLSSVDALHERRKFAQGEVYVTLYTSERCENYGLAAQEVATYYQNVLTEISQRIPLFR